MRQDGDRDPVRPGIFDSVKSLLATVAGMAYARVELIGNELRAEVDRAASMLLRGFFALLLVTLGFLLAAAAVVVAFWDSYRLLATILLSAGAFVAGGALWFSVRASGGGPRPFEATLTELTKDQRELRGPS
jgi:uncharacterized membrane protein YqjE